MLIKYDRLHVYHHWQIHLLSFFFFFLYSFALKKNGVKINLHTLF